MTCKKYGDLIRVSAEPLQPHQSRFIFNNNNNLIEINLRKIIIITVLELNLKILKLMIEFPSRIYRDPNKIKP